MGLDISAYGGCRLVEVVVDEDGEPVDENDWNKARAWVNPHFPKQADDLVDRGFYETDDSMGFRAGSYRGYNRWRENLAKLAGYTADDAFEGRVTTGPFIEMVNFSDCEGAIGPKTSAKLAADFGVFETIAEQQMVGYELDLYRQWKKAFEMAARNGFVGFH